MRYLSVCSGIEAASVAWHDLGWEAAGFSEIERFPSEVLRHRFPNVRNYGDMTNFKEWQDVGTVDLLVGGTPCQSFSVAGLRKGLDDPRGNLMLSFGAMASHFRPKWVVWENVPGVLSSNGGRDFGTFLGMLAECGYGFAYRVLDAQYFGVAQRRRRVFVVGHLGDWRCAAAVLFESESLSGNPPPSRSKGEGIARGVEIGPGGGRFTEVSATLDTKCKDGPVRNQVGMAICAPLTIASKQQTQSIGIDIAAPILAGDYKEPQVVCLMDQGGQIMNVEHDKAGTLRAQMGGQDPVVACYGLPGNWINRKPENGGNATAPMNDVSPCLTGADRHAVCLMDQGGAVMGIEQNKTGTLRAQMNGHAPIVLAHGQANAESLCDKCPTLNRNHEQPIVFNAQGSASQGASVGEVSPTLDRSKTPAVCFQQNTRDEVRLIAGDGGIAGALSASAGMKQQNYLCEDAVVRRLTPVECERLQGFPDNWTRIPYRGKPAEQCPDGPRYKACGNSMAVPVMRWIGERIQMMEDIMTERDLFGEVDK